VNNLILVYLFLVYSSISICFGQLYAHHQEKQSLGTCYSVWMTVWYAE